MSTFGDLLKYLKIYRRYLGRRMYLIFVLTVATALAQGFGITLLLPLLRASQSGSGTPEDMGTAERAHADHFIRELPNGYRTVVGDRGVRLSGCSALSEAKK